MTASKPDIHLPVDVIGSLELEGPSGRTLTLRANGSGLRLSAPEWQDLRQLGPRSLLAQRRWLGAAAKSMAHLNITLAVQVADRPVMHLGDRTKATVFARLLGLSSVSLGFNSALKLLLSRR